MRNYNASSPAVRPYIDWLREALAPNPRDALSVPSYGYYWFSDGIYYRVGLADIVWSQKAGKEIPTIRQTGSNTVLCTGYLDESDPDHCKLSSKACFTPPHPRLQYLHRPSGNA